jgi:hypothetical protein
MKTKYIILSVVTAFVLGLLCNCPFGCQNAVKTEIREKLLIDTLYITKTDTMPVPKTEYIVKYIKVPVPKDSTSTGNVDSLQLEVVQRTYSDDSTYTAYVSGVAVDSFPRLDSISVTQRTILIDHEIERTIIKKRPLTFGVQGGAGYGITTKKPDIYIGIGLQWNF